MVLDGVQVWVIVQDFEFQVVLLDIVMFGLDGYEVCCCVWVMGWGCDVLLIVSSGWGQVEMCCELVDVGFDYYFVKLLDYVVVDVLLVECSCGF